MIFIIIIIVLLCPNYATIVANSSSSIGNQLVTDGNGNGNGNGANINKSCFHNEKQALLNFKASLEDPYGQLSTWRAEDDDCCKWSGVICNNQTLHVTELHVKEFHVTELQLVFVDGIRGGLRGEISPSLLNLTYLNHLHLSENYFNGTIPNFIGSMTQLRYLDLSDNSFNGTIPTSIGSLTQLRYLDLSNNFLHGTIPTEFGNLTSLQNLSLGPLEGCLIENIDWLSNLSNLQHLEMEKISLAKANYWIDVILSLPKLSFLSLKECDLDISNNNISEVIPVEFWKTWPSQLTYLDLSSNNFHGPIPNVPPTLVSLNLSKNKFYGGISFICRIVDGFLSLLDLTHNSLTGHLPDCLWHFKELKVLNLGHNNLSGRLPASIGYAVHLEVLNLNNNNFSGELPLALKNCTELKFLNLGANKFSGNVPVWLGENLTGLYVLSLRSNNFFGPIPLQLCRLLNLQILDLSINNLNATIPSCVNNLNAMVQGSFLRRQHIHRFGSDYYEKGDITMILSYIDRMIFECQGRKHEFTVILRFGTSIDLSSNNLTGQIPDELTDLLELDVLNLSRNALLGEIPQKIGELDELFILDLSRNNISGRIPSSMSQLDFLGYLDMSHNSLSGRIPTGTQLQAFEPSSYIGNARLCGPPLTKNCPGDEVPSTIGESESESGEEGTDELESWFYVGGATGFAIGFWMACGAFLLNDYGRLGLRKGGGVHSKIGEGCT